MRENDTPEHSSEPDSESDARRVFLRKVGRASAAAPAVALLMAANIKPANAQRAYGSGNGGSASGSS
jgi:hypothetical protein